MSQIAAYAWEAPQPEVEYFQPLAAAEPRPRSLIQPILLCVPTFMAVMAYFCGGLMPLADAAFLTLAILCAIFLAMEMWRFSERFGIGGIALYGGVLVWFCYDYFSHWFLAWMRGWNMPFSEIVVSRSVAAHMVLILFMSIGLRQNVGRLFFRRWLSRLPEPGNPALFLVIITMTQIIGLMPYSMFTAEPFYMAMWHQIQAGRTGIGAAWTVGRSGNENYLWGAYVAQILQVGEGGSLLAAFYLVFLSRSWFSRIYCFSIWLLWLALGFGTGTRGEVAYMMVPMIGFIFIRYHMRAAELFHRISLRAYVWIAILGVVGVALIQTQIRFRNQGFVDVDIHDVSLIDLQGNTMFSEGLAGFVRIPDQHTYFYDKWFPGSTVILPIPNTIFWCLIHPIPRAAWHGKWLDPASPWYNDVAMGGSGEGGGRIEGTTISEGLAGYWFFRFGIAGLVEGGLIVGWIMSFGERLLFQSRGRSLSMLMALGIETWIFRCYRDMSFPELYQFMIPMLAMVILTWCMRPFFGGSPLQYVPYEETY